MSVTDTTSGLSLNDILANSSIKTSTSDRRPGVGDEQRHRQKGPGQGRVPAIAGDPAEKPEPAGSAGQRCVRCPVGAVQQPGRHHHAQRHRQWPGEQLQLVPGVAGVVAGRAFGDCTGRQRRWSIPPRASPAPLPCRRRWTRSRSRSPMPMARLSAPSTWAARAAGSCQLHLGRQERRTAKWPRRVPIPSAPRRPIDGKATSLVTYLPATVNSVTISQTGGELMLNLAGLGSIALSKVQTIGM